MVNTSALKKGVPPLRERTTGTRSKPTPGLPKERISRSN